MAKNYWLMKSEPNTYSIADLQRDQKTCWEGVRNYQARNLMRDDMRVGDEVLFYHSSAKPAGVAGLARVCAAAYPDHTALDKKSKYYDEKATKDNPIWMMVDVEFVAAFPEIISLETIKSTAALSGILVAKRGMRLSVQPVEKKHFDFIRKMAK